MWTKQRVRYHRRGGRTHLSLRQTSRCCVKLRHGQRPLGNASHNVNLMKSRAAVRSGAPYCEKALSQVGGSAKGPQPRGPLQQGCRNKWALDGARLHPSGPAAPWPIPLRLRK